MTDKVHFILEFYITFNHHAIFVNEGLNGVVAFTVFG